jgi:hypothetical protein
MAYDAIRGMILVHKFDHIELCAEPEKCDKALLLISTNSDIDIVAKLQNTLRLFSKECFVFNIYGNKTSASVSALKLIGEPWSEKKILTILKKL